jgi:hypothetical protein
VVGTKLISEGDREAVSRRAKEFFQKLSLDWADDVDVTAELRGDHEAVLNVRFLKAGGEVKKVEIDLTMGPDGIVKMRQRDVTSWRDRIISETALPSVREDIRWGTSAAVAKLRSGRGSIGTPSFLPIVFSVFGASLAVSTANAAIGEGIPGLGSLRVFLVAGSPRL